MAVPAAVSAATRRGLSSLLLPDCRPRLSGFVPANPAPAGAKTFSPCVLKSALSAISRQKCRSLASLSSKLATPEFAVPRHGAGPQWDGGSRFLSSAASAGKVVPVPSMGDSITEGSLNEWKKQPGDYVREGDLVAVIDTDKVSVDINAPESGRIVKFEANAGDTVEVGKPLYVIDPTAQPDPAEVAPPAPAPKTEEPKSSSAQPPAEKAKTPTPPKAPTAPAPSATSGKASKTAAAPAGVQSAGREEKRVGEEGDRPTESRGTAKDRDPRAPAINEETARLEGGEAENGERRRARGKVPMSRMRQRIAERLKGAQNTAAMLTTFNECDMGNLMAMRSELNPAFQERHGVKMGFVSAFMLASAMAMKKVPEVNAFIEGTEIVYKSNVDISVAVATPTGLMVPVVRDCERKSWPELEKELAALAVKARNNQIALEDMAGGTFTISNGGVYGSMMGTPILNPPQSSILGMHGITKRAVVKNDQVVIRPMMYLALTYDHRLIDGREAVTFLCHIRDYIEDPRLMLLDL